MGENKILKKNEYEANRLASKIMLVTIGFIVLVYILNTLELFKVEKPTMALACAGSVLLLVIPYVVVYLFKQQGAWVKYLTVTASALMMTVLSIFLTYHVVVMYLFTLAISSLYFSRRLVITSYSIHYTKLYE